jgi:glycosyltransferase involved in cell wall biosynthesis
MRVLSVTGGLDLGGTERYLSRVLPILRDRYRVEADVCVLWPGGALEAEMRSHGVPVFTTSPRGDRPPMAMRALRAVAGIARLVRERRYDLVHSYLFPAEAFATIAARWAGCPRVIVGRRTIQPLRRPRGPGPFVVETITNALAHELVANSRAVLRDSERGAIVLPRRRTVIYSGVDVASFPRAVPRTDGPLRIVTVGSLWRVKGHRDLIRAIGALGRSGTGATATLVGIGPEEPALRRLAADEGVADRVTFAGLQPDPRPFLAAADVFALPSYAEGFSNALLEAMASGLPAVVTDVGGNAEALVDGAGGVLVPAGDVAALTRALAGIARDRERLAAMGQANRERAERHFDLRVAADALAQWYRGAERLRREGPPAQDGDPRSI